MTDPAAPFDAASYDEIEPGYYDRVHRRGRGVQWFWHEHRFRTVERLLPKPLGQVLDLGCGPGTFLGRLEEPFADGLGIDLADPQIEYARRTYARSGLSFRQGDVRELVGGSSFDAVVSVEVIEHLPPAEANGFLRTIWSLLRPGGTVILTTPNYRSLWPLLEVLVSVLGPVDYRAQHINPLNADRLGLALEETGFEAVTVDTFYVAAPFLAAVSSRLAERCLAWERRLLPRLGAELVARARRPEAR